MDLRAAHRAGSHPAVVILGPLRGGVRRQEPAESDAWAGALPDVTTDAPLEPPAADVERLAGPELGVPARAGARPAQRPAELVLCRRGGGRSAARSSAAVRRVAGPVQLSRRSTRKPRLLALLLPAARADAAEPGEVESLPRAAAEALSQTDVPARSASQLLEQAERAVSELSERGRQPPVWFQSAALLEDGAVGRELLQPVAAC
jgi:hypothetical protein